jgi:hypothetical protein
LSSGSDLTFLGTSTTNLRLEVAGTLTNNGSWTGFVSVGSALINNGNISGGAQYGTSCSGFCGPPEINPGSKFSLYTPSFYVEDVLMFFSCLSDSACLWISLCHRPFTIFGLASEK